MVINLHHLLKKEIIYELLSIQDIVRWITSCFNMSNLWYGHGNDNPWDEALNLVLSVLSLPPYLWDKVYNAKLSFKERKLIYKLVLKRIKKKIPVVYLTKKTWFCGHELYIDNRVLIPRSPISELINNKFKYIIPSYKKPRYILDLCTGSGCIAIACAYLFPNSHIDAVDISLDAINVTEYNIQLHGLENRITPICSNLFEKLKKLNYDLIITNPPYVDKKDINFLPKEYSYEPKISLVSDNNGTEIIEKIISQAFSYLKKDGILICEVGDKMINIIEKYPEKCFQWLNIKNGGIGIFKMQNI
ncbi:50S ribosomal protein L3 N(5)-glutamine methyltransferase [Enterobacteriaceae endosymbiont of Donacia versicolorea]|uniref:50S ribosomal protein L3 N(5)-glutamine methyltransferase n=1 Tax=Enterobacteriaceae endosymbiont of Donacia versicolorea TaxID=2675788 RepID=UPI0014490D91|nr:50S ribosomal protein L3 N(5)-glutamine methyltransferase [Enterobacteriaceae endosymbiont of Donacia versicolorea]QJC32024.1 50S ribosomal protein L3 N(5)-glutamine methyltransferase [Enterobacteriaceae endosymbiont of Donacia versicolorea]